MQHLKIPEIVRNQGSSSAPAIVGRPATFVEMREARIKELSLPEWVAWRVKWSTSSVDRNGERLPVLHDSIGPMNAAETAQIDRKIEAVGRFVAVETWPVVSDHDDEGRPVAVTAEQAKLILITKMLLAKASANVTAAGTEARGESYLIALRDVPAWAVEAAIADWYRGDVPDVEKKDFRWSPDSSLLRDAAMRHVKRYADLLDALVRVRDARPLAEIAP